MDGKVSFSAEVKVTSLRADRPIGKVRILQSREPLCVSPEMLNSGNGMFQIKLKWNDQYSRNVKPDTTLAGKLDLEITVEPRQFIETIPFTFKVRAQQ